MTASRGSSDGFMWGDGFLVRIDPRVKILAVVGLLMVNMLSGNPAVPVLIAVVMLALMLVGRIPYRRQLLMIAFPAAFAFFVVASQTVFAGSRVVAAMGPFDLHSDGFGHGLYLSARIVAGGLVVVLLGATTPLSRICLALKWFRAPATFVELLQITYRYLFDIHAELFRMKDAQRARLGWSSSRRGLASSRMLGGSLFVRVYDRGCRSSEAMRCRGAGPLVAGRLPQFTGLDMAALAASSSLLAALSTLPLWIPWP